jgi:hypothetical protein
MQVLLIEPESVRCKILMTKFSIQGTAPYRENADSSTARLIGRAIRSIQNLHQKLLNYFRLLLIDAMKVVDE